VSEIAVSFRGLLTPRTRRRLWLAVVLVCVALVALGARATVASAATFNTKADRAALQAYANYLSQLDNQLPTVRSREQQKLGCHAVFTLGSSRGTVLSSANETALQDEISELVALRAVSLTAKPLATLKRHLQLAWSTPAYVVDTDQYLSAEARFVALPPPTVCADAHAAANTPSGAPSSTVVTYIRRYFQTYKAAKSRQKTFVNDVLVHNEAAGDLALIKRINHLANVYQSRITSITEAETETITTTLGLS
jgi:hypothetical protein